MTPRTPDEQASDLVMLWQLMETPLADVMTIANAHSQLPRTMAATGANAREVAYFMGRDAIVQLAAQSYAGFAPSIGTVSPQPPSGPRRVS